MIFAHARGKRRRICAIISAVVFLTLSGLMASLSPDKIFAGLSPQNSAESLIRAIQIIGGASLAEVSCSVPRSDVAWAGSGHYTEISFISGAGSYAGAKPAHNFTDPPARYAGGADTVARE